eukprot:GHRQ01024848.1.p1 GENE.GHRQ01024848.1~~GHRQ01024848.1.p1  ORF type:complete len:170 (+),score=2.41 GHRQ01024848.1:637-1146(+)
MPTTKMALSFCKPLLMMGALKMALMWRKLRSSCSCRCGVWAAISRLPRSKYCQAKSYCLKKVHAVTLSISCAASVAGALCTAEIAIASPAGGCQTMAKGRGQNRRAQGMALYRVPPIMSTGSARCTRPSFTPQCAYSLEAVVVLVNRKMQPHQLYAGSTTDPVGLLPLE